MNIYFQIKSLLLHIYQNLVKVLIRAICTEIIRPETFHNDQ